MNKNKFIMLLLSSFLLVSVVTGCSSVQKQESTDGSAAVSGQLPKSTEIKYTERPIMWDFLNGTLGWHSKQVTEREGYDLFYFFATNDSGDVWVSSYMPSYADSKTAEKTKLPRYGTGVFKIPFQSEEDKNKFLSDLKAEKSKFEEDNFTFYKVMDSYAQESGGYKDNKFSILEFATIPYTKSEYGQMLESGQGYPTELLREEYSESMKNMKIDINDPFWDDVNYGSHLKCMRLNKEKGNRIGTYSTDFVTLTPITTQIVSGNGMPFVLSYSIDNQTYPMDLEGIDQLLIENGYESIEQAVKGKQFVTQEEFKNIK